MKRYALLIFILTLTVLCFSAGWIEAALHVSGESADLANRFHPPSWTHFFGTDELGRDIFIRILQGGQVSLTVAFIAALIATAIGTTIGMTAGYFGGITDALLMRLTDFLIALPALPLLIVLTAIDFDKIGLGAFGNNSMYKIIFLIALMGWTTVARLARAQTLTIKEMDFTRAARALGVTHAKLIWRHILPNIMDTIVVAAALSVGNIILAESALSFLGLGIHPPQASWGNMLSNAQENIWDHASLAIFPGVMIFVTVLTFNFLGDTLQSGRRYEGKTV